VAAQSFQKATYSDAYCAGFIAQERMVQDLRIVQAEDSPGMLIFATNDLVYLGQGEDAGITTGQRLMIVRSVQSADPVEAYSGQNWVTSPGWDASVGHMYEDVGQLEVEQVYPTISVARITFACGAVRAGDILMPFENRPLPDYKGTEVVQRFTPPSGLASGTIVAAKDFAYMLGNGGAIYVTMGTEHGLKAGDYLLLYRDGKGPRFRGANQITKGFIQSHAGQGADGKIPAFREDLPREILGEAFVVRAEGAASTAIITANLREVHPGDYVELRPFPEPQIMLSAVPLSINKGEAATLSWSSKFTDTVSLQPGPGAIDKMGTFNVNPGETTIYTVTAQGPSGTSQATVTVEVIEPPPPPPPPTQPPPPDTPDDPGPTMADLFAELVRDVFFDFDKAQLSEQAQSSLQQVSVFLNEFPEARLLIEGHTDDVAGEAYNQILGQKRADAVRDYLVALGVNADQLETVSLGETRLFCTESQDDACRQLNRRGHFILQ
jgi:peptidoglycan-associated lipoprotein